MPPFVALHNVRALLLLAEEVEFHATAGIDAANRVLSSASDHVHWADLYNLATHAGCAGAFLQTSPSRNKALTIVFPGRAEAFAALTAIDEDLSEIKGVRDAMIHADERLEAEWIRREALGEIHDGLAMRAVGSLPAREGALINWDPSTRELSGRKAHANDNSRELDYHTVNIVDLRDQLRNIEFGVSRLSFYVESMTDAAPGPHPLPWRATKTVSTDPR